MRYRRTYLSTHDVSFFLRINDIPIFCMSNTGNLPDFINNIVENRKNQREAFAIEQKEIPIIFNSEYIEHRFKNADKDNDYKSNDEIIENYKSFFKKYAYRGFLCFDRDVESNIDTPVYRWICCPEYSKDYTEMVLPTLSVDGFDQKTLLLNVEGEILPSKEFK